MANISFKDMMELLMIEKYRKFLTFDKVVNRGTEEMWKDYCSQITSPDVDPTDVFAEEVEYFKNIEYSMKLMNICCLCETWEQDLYNFLKEKGLIEVRSNDYARTKQIFENNYPECRISGYPLIGEMRALVNAIKHGEGNSFSNLRRLTADSILADSNIGVVDESGVVVRKKEIEFDSNTLTSRTLNVEGKLEAYSEALVSFWQGVFEIERARGSTRARE